MNIALLVGVNHYKISGNDLQGCENDVISMRKMLVNQFGFSVMQVRTLINENATKKNIIRLLEKMTAQAMKGDHLVFHFSGHGSQVPCTEGDESDRLDEILCPHDFDWSGTYIEDDELRKIFSRLDGGATADVILDCCHSGTGLRELGDPVARFILNPNLKNIEYNPIYMLKGHELSNVALWSGCKDNQTSADAFIYNKYQGAMTWAFCQQAGKSKNRILDWQHMKVTLSQKNFDQEPQLECSDEMKKQKIFK